MPLTDDELVGLACMRELMEGDVDDLNHLEDDLANDEDDDDSHEIAMAAYHYTMAADYITRILNRHDEMIQKGQKEKKSTCTDLVLVRKGDTYTMEEKVEKKLTEMTIQEIGEGTVLFDPQGEAWVATLWTEKVMDLKNGHVTRANVKPKDLVGWSFDGRTFDEQVDDLILEIKGDQDEREGLAGAIAAEVVKRRSAVGNPIGLIKAVYGALEKA